jgi:hypothetical protein
MPCRAGVALIGRMQASAAAGHRLGARLYEWLYNGWLGAAM